MRYSSVNKLIIIEPRVEPCVNQRQPSQVHLFCTAY